MNLYTSGLIMIAAGLTDFAVLYYIQTMVDIHVVAGMMAAGIILVLVGGMLTRSMSDLRNNNAIRKRTTGETKA